MNIYVYILSVGYVPMPVFRSGSVSTWHSASQSLSASLLRTLCLGHEPVGPSRPARCG